ncbi:MAG TPA: NUDIX domain-containing protein [Acidimicrobiales bacterium]|nr:NUDIX domain-containing protein [Acidimicrobiales bacterium]
MVEVLLSGGGDGPVHDAATVVLVRDGAGGPECLMLRKTSGQAFGGMWVFPGGRVEDGDGTGLDGARRAAVREAEEETGLVLDEATLVPFAHWSPPPQAPRRYDTWFFLAPLPDGAAEVVVDGGEIGDHVWTTAANALARHRAREIDLMPPTWVTLDGLVGAADVAAAVAQAGSGEIDRFATRIADHDGMLVSMWRGDTAYESGDTASPGPRHRLYMDPAGWRYERSG